MSRHFSAHADTVDDGLRIETPWLMIAGTGVYCAYTGRLMSVRIGAREVPVHQIEDALSVLAPYLSPAWSADLRRAKLEDLNAGDFT